MSVNTALNNTLNSASLAIETRGLTRYYGKLAAVQDLNLAIPQGSLFGLIGPNGAGKTTTLRMLAGLLDPSAGEIIVNGTVASAGRGFHALKGNQADLRRQIGYMPDFFGVYEDLVVWEYLDFFARCYNLPAKRRTQVIDELLDLVDLTEKRDAYVHTLSRGMRQRLCLAHAMVHDPQVLLLDEPASGLDPRARVEMRELLRELGAMGKTVVLSSHILAELAELCDSIGIIERGHLVVSGRLEDVRARVQAGKKLRIRVLSDAGNPVDVASVETLLRAQPGVGQVYLMDEPNGAGNGNGAHAEREEEGSHAERGNQTTDQTLDQTPAPEARELEVDFSGDENAVADLLETLIAAKTRIASFSETNTGLEEVFLRLTKGEVA